MATKIDQIGYSSRNEIIEEIQLRLADGMVDVELDRDHYDIAINKSIQKYRQLSTGSVEEAVIFIQTQAGVTKYTLPDEVIAVKRLYRRGFGTNPICRALIARLCARSGSRFCKTFNRLLRNSGLTSWYQVTSNYLIL